MTDVSPIDGLLGPGGVIGSDEELRQRVAQLEWVVYQLRERTGGDVDAVENIEFTITVQDGGNRAMIRRYRDEIDEVGARIDDSKRPKDYRDQIQNLHDQIADLRRKNNALSASISDLSDQLNSTKRLARTADQNVFSLSEQISINKRSTKSVEQKLNELVERYDSGA